MPSLKLPHKIQKIGIITKSNIAEKKEVLKKLVQHLQKHHKEVFFDAHCALLIGVAKTGYERAALLAMCDLVIVLGGDGTLLKTASHAVRKKTLVLGVNVGTLGFLTEITPKNLSQALEKIFHNEFTVDSRSLLRVTHYRSGKKLNTFLALNDAVINQGSFARLIEMQIEINKKRVIGFKGDGLIISSPTGSTGHSLSAGGPIVHPSLPAIVLTPICPATLSIRPIVIPNDRQIKITVTTRRQENQNVGLTLDGQTTIPLQYGDEIKIRKSARQFYLIRLKNGKNYYQMLRTKLHWGLQHHN